jgi:hypothetical protein
MVMMVMTMTSARITYTASHIHKSPHSLCTHSHTPYVPTPALPMSPLPHSLCPHSHTPYVPTPALPMSPLPHSLVPISTLPMSPLPHSLCPHSHTSYVPTPTHFVSPQLPLKHLNTSTPVASPKCTRCIDRNYSRLRKLSKASMT